MRFSPVLALLALTLPAAAQVQLVEAGIVCPRTTDGEMIDAPGTESGFIRQIDAGLVFDLPDRTVPTMDQLGFGFRVSLEPGEPETEVTIVVTHPPMGDRGIRRQEWQDILVPGSTSMNMFTFELDYEKVPGPWSFSIEIGGKAVVSVPFEVTETENQGRVEQACFQFLS